MGVNTVWSFQVLQRLFCVGFVGICLFSGVQNLEAEAEAFREPGAIYLSDFTKDPFEVRIEQPVDAFFKNDMQRYLGTLRPRQNAVLLAVSPGLAKVRARAQQGQVAGWIPLQGLEPPLDPDFLRNLNLANERMVKVRELIALKEVGLGMRPEEVELSLGKPTRQSSKTDPTGTTQVWEYIQYESVARTVVAYDTFGQPFNSIVYERVPKGTLGVTFSSGVVTALESSEQNLRGSGGIKIVPAPIFFP